MTRLEQAMSSFAMCNATDCHYHDGGGCTCYTVDLIRRSIGGGRYIVVCADYMRQGEADDQEGSNPIRSERQEVAR